MNVKEVRFRTDMLARVVLCLLVSGSNTRDMYMLHCVSTSVTTVNLYLGSMNVSYCVYWCQDQNTSAGYLYMLNCLYTSVTIVAQCLESIHMSWSVYRCQDQRPVLQICTCYRVCLLVSRSQNCALNLYTCYCLFIGIKYQCWKFVHFTKSVYQCHGRRLVSRSEHVP